MANVLMERKIDKWEFGLYEILDWRYKRELFLYDDKYYRTHKGATQEKAKSSNAVGIIKITFSYCDKFRTTIGLPCNEHQTKSPPITESFLFIHHNKGVSAILQHWSCIKNFF